MRMDMPNLQTIHHFDVIIVGSGGAGLSLALSLPNHFNIAVLAKAALTEASTFMLKVALLLFSMRLTLFNSILMTL